MRPALLAAALLWAGRQNAPAQEVPTPPAFDAASVKPASPAADLRSAGCRGGPGSDDPGQLICTSASLKLLVFFAYSVAPYQVTGPAWIASTLYDVAAKVPAAVTRDQVRLMLRTLLADRFHLVLNRETREIGAYTLVVAKNGPKMPASGGDDASAPTEKDGFPPFPPNGGFFYRVQNGSFLLKMKNQPMAQLAKVLSDRLAVLVQDHTGLSGKFDFTLTFALDQGPDPEQADETAGVFTAVREQLGLRLQAGKAPVEILVVERADRIPVEN